MDARSSSLRPAARRISCTMAFLPCPYSSMSAAVVATRRFTAAYSSRSAASARSASRTARWLRSAREPSTTTYVWFRGQSAGCLNAHCCGIPSSPTGRNPRATSTSDAASTCCSTTTMSQSMTGFAAKPGTAVLPTCSIATNGTPAESRAAT
jgi:hypothetical protein